MNKTLHFGFEVLWWHWRQNHPSRGRKSNKPDGREAVREVASRNNKKDWKKWGTRGSYDDILLKKAPKENMAKATKTTRLRGGGRRGWAGSTTYFHTYRHRWKWT